MNTKNTQDRKKSQQKNRQDQGPKKQGRNSNLIHGDPKYQEHEHAEMRLTR